MRAIAILLVALLAGCHVVGGGEQVSHQDRGLYKGQWLTDAGDSLYVQGMFTGDGRLLLASFRDGANVPDDVVFADLSQQGDFLAAQGLDFNGRRVLDFSMNGNFVSGWQFNADYQLSDNVVQETGVLYLDHVSGDEAPASALGGDWSDGILTLHIHHGQVSGESEANSACYFPDGYLDADASGTALFSGVLTGVGCEAGEPDLQLDYSTLAYVDANGLCGGNVDTLVLGFYAGDSVQYHELCRR